MKILIVDDEEDLVKLLKIRLAKAGYEVLTATNGRDGLSACIDKKPALLLTDVLMPQMTGYEMVRQIRAKGGDFSKMPVIVLTAKGSMKDFFDQFDNIVFTQKPFDQQKLLEMVDESIKKISAGLAYGGTVLADQSRTSAKSKKIMLLGADEFILEKLKNFLVASGHQVYPIHDEKDAIAKVSDIRPDAFFIQFFEDAETLDARKVYDYFTRAAETKSIPFVIFCRAGLDIDAYQTMKSAYILPYAESADLIKTVETFIKDKL